MYTLDITDAAEQDLDRITDYLGVTLANPQAALALLDEVEKINAELASNPSIYPLSTLNERFFLMDNSLTVLFATITVAVERVRRLFNVFRNQRRLIVGVICHSRL